MTYFIKNYSILEGWLEPLLARIAADRKTVVCPIIDVISDDTFEYITASDMTWGGFNWKLNFRWYNYFLLELKNSLYLNYKFIYFFIMIIDYICLLLSNLLKFLCVINCTLVRI